MTRFDPCSKDRSLSAMSPDDRSTLQSDPDLKAEAVRHTTAHEADPMSMPVAALDTDQHHHLSAGTEIEPLPILNVPADVKIEDSLATDGLGDPFSVLQEETSILGKRKAPSEKESPTAAAPMSVEQQASRVIPDSTVAKHQMDQLSEPTEEGTKEGGLKLLFAASLLQQKKGPKNQDSDTHSPSNASIVPTHCDVCCGRGGSTNRHPGNIVYRKVVEFNKNIYKQVPKRHRNLVPQSIVQTIINSGGRFLMHVSGSSWTEIPFHRAVLKTSQALREKTKGQNPASSSNIIPSPHTEGILCTPSPSQTQPV